MTTTTVICRLASSIRTLLARRCTDENCLLRSSEFGEGAAHGPVDTHKLAHQVVNALKIFEAGLKELHENEKPSEKESWWNRILELVERVPILGFLIALYHFIKGDKDKAKGALARCTRSSVIAGGTKIDMLLGGPLGACLGAGIAAPIALLLEYYIAQFISDEDMRHEFGSITWKRIFWDIFIIVLQTGAFGLLVGCITPILAAAAVY